MKIEISRQNTYQVADVTLGILFSGAILLSSIGILLNLPASSSHSSECAATLAMSTSPPK